MTERRLTRPSSKFGDECGDALDLRAKATLDGGVLSGYGSKFWVVDSYGEFTIPGCFQKSIDERGPTGKDRILYRYEHDITIGKPTVLREDADGLYLEAKISDDGLWGTALRRQLADGVPYGQSIGFRRVGFRSATETDPLIFDFAPPWVMQVPRTELIGITECKLPEISSVSFPAVDNATVDDYRSAQRVALLASLIPDLKAGRLSEDELEALKEAAAAIADGRDLPSEMQKQTPTTRTSQACALELSLVAARLKSQGVNILGAN